MDFTVTRRMLDPATDFGGGGGPLPRVGEVACLSVEVKRRPAFYGYDAMLEAAYGEMAPFVDRLEDRGFRAFVFLVGADLTLARVAALPRYDLWSPAGRLGLDHREAVTEDLLRDGRRRRIGLYGIDVGDLFLACRFQSRANGCVIALSADPGFPSRPTLMALHAAARAQAGRRGVDLLWHDLARCVCDAGHVLLQEFGEFDDLHRVLTLCVPRPVWGAVA